ncbi:MAG: DUF4173 domain-containing protein [Bacteroidetes bacterium]|nr:DUF4173 domain-containing protein [Bacteroidota bacterium]
MKNALISNRFIGFTALIVLFILCFFRAPTPGLNWLLYVFGALVITLLITKRQNVRSILIPSIGLLACSVAVFIHSDALAIVMTILSFGYLGVSLVIAKVDPGFGAFAGFLNFIISPFGVIIRFFQRLNTKNGKFKGLFTTLLIPIVLITFFSILYYQSSPAFKELLNAIRFKHFPQFVGTAVLGLFSASVLLYCFAPQKLNKMYDNISQKSDTISTYMGSGQYTNSWLIGVWSVVGLLAFVLISDVMYHPSQAVSQDFSYSGYVHQGVYASIFSIVASAILTVLTTNYLGDQNKAPFRIANYVFIGLNMLFIFQNVLRNYSYIGQYGLTEKRLIIFIYLILCIVGLLLTVVTIAQNKSLGFLYKTNAFNVYIALIISALLNWSTIITQYNLNHPYGFEKHIDYHYLFSLDNSNTYLLKDHYDKFDEDLQRRFTYRSERIQNYEAYNAREWILSKTTSKERLKALDK